MTDIPAPPGPLPDVPTDPVEAFRRRLSELKAAHRDQPVLKVARTERGKDLPLPAYASAGAAGIDLHADVQPGDVGMMVLPKEIRVVPTGIMVEIPPGYEGQIRSRSGLAFKLGVVAFPGTIDSDYRGEVKVLLFNHGFDALMVKRGGRIAQLVIAPVARVQIEETVALGETERGAGGFGSTGQ